VREALKGRYEELEAEGFISADEEVYERLEYETSK
jgi:hypothetical protein